MEGVKKIQSTQYMRTVEPDSIYSVSKGRTLLKFENLCMRLELVRLRGSQKCYVHGYLLSKAEMRYSLTVMFMGLHLFRPRIPQPRNLH